MGEESNRRDAPNVFERARQALMSQLQQAPAVVDVLAVPSLTMSPMAQASVAVQLAMNDRTQHVVVRLIDARTGAVLLEMPSTALAVVAARVGPVVHGAATKASMR
jgi:nucleoside phosphorylase